MRLELCPCCKSRAELRNTLGKTFWIQCTNPECGLQTKKCGCDYADEIVTQIWNNRVVDEIADNRIISFDVSGTKAR